MPDFNYNDIETLTSMTLDEYLGRPGSKHNLISEVALKDYLAGRMFRRASDSSEGGPNLQWPIQFSEADVVKAIGPYTKMTPGGTPAPTWGSVPRRFIGWSWYKPFVELHMNRGKQQVLLDILKQAKSDVGINLVNRLETWMLARDGNYAHDGDGADFLLILGLLYWVTIDGLHVTGDTTKSVGGINPNTEPLWKNQYISPISASDGMKPISSILQLRQSLDRMMRQMRWDSPKTWNVQSGDIENSPTVDPDSKETPKDFMLCTDPGTSIDLRGVLFDREDDVGRDQARGRPVYKGMEIFDSEKLGLGTSGYGFDHDGNTLWTDRTGNYASGKWVSHGEMIGVNLKYFSYITHPLHKPYVKKTYTPEGMFGICNEGDFWLNTMCRSRRRGLFYIGPYPLDVAA